jgi:hypothetical protein
MGYYIQGPNRGKASDILIRIPGSRILTKPDPSLLDEGSEDVLICVVSNGGFDAAGVAFSKRDLAEWMDPSDPRPKVWISANRNMVRRLSGAPI